MEFIFGIYIEEEGMDDWMVCASLCVAALAGRNKMQGPISHFPMNTTLLLSGIVPPACKMLNIIEYTPLLFNALSWTLSLGVVFSPKRWQQIC